MADFSKKAIFFLLLVLSEFILVLLVQLLAIFGFFFVYGEGMKAARAMEFWNPIILYFPLVLLVAFCVFQFYRKRDSVYGRIYLFSGSITIVLLFVVKAAFHW